MSMTTRILRMVAILAIALISVSAAARLGRVGGPLGGASSRVAARLPMQTAVPGRVTMQTSAGVRTAHAVAPQPRVIENIIGRAQLKDPLLTHRVNLAELRKAGQNSAELATFRAPNYDLVLRVEKGATAQMSFNEVPAGLAGTLQRFQYLPSALKAKEGAWSVDVVGKSVPLRPEVIRRTSAAAAM